MNYQPQPLRKYDIAVGDNDERVIPLLTGFVLGAPFWGSLARPYYPYPYAYPYAYPYSYPYSYPYYSPYRRRRWY